jgi:lysophospholipase L1-like esterase
MARRIIHDFHPLTAAVLSRRFGANLPWRMRPIFIKSLAALAVVAVSLAALEFGVRAAGLTPKFEYSSLVIKLDVDALYRVEPGGRLKINSHGYRDREFGPHDGTKTRVLMAGDSFLMDVKSPEAESLPRVLERELGTGFEVMNMGTTGYGPDQSLIRMREDGYALDPDVVVLTIFAANDFEDLRKNEIFEVAPDGGIERSRSNPVSRLLRPLQLISVLRNAVKDEFFAPEDQKELLHSLFTDRYDWNLIRKSESPESLRKLALMRGVLAAFDAELTSRGADFGVVIIPSWVGISRHKTFARRGIPPDQYFRLEELAASLCQELDVPFVDLTHAFSSHGGEPLFKELDGHFTTLGNEVSARETAQLIQRMRAADSL